MAHVPSGDGTADSAHMADLALNLADQLISAFQQEADGAGEGQGDAAQEDGMLPSDNGAVDLEADVRDGNDEWQDLPEDEDLMESYDNGVKEEGVGEENPQSCLSPVGSHVLDADSMDPDNHENDEIMFSPARMLNFDDSDGDDLSVDQRFIPRGVFAQSEVLDDRPELHGSEEASYFSGSARTNMLLGDYSQNVRIIEGHDDLDLDRGAGYMSLTMRNHFLQTQMVQLPPFSGDDPNTSAHLYDSLEREEEEELYPEDEQGQEGDEDNARLLGRDDTGRDNLNDPRNADPLSLDVHFVQEDPNSSHHGHQQSRGMERKDQDQHDHFHEDGKEAGAAEMHSVIHISQDREQEHEDLSQKSDNPGVASRVHRPSNDDLHGGGSTLVVTLPKSSNSGMNQSQDSADGSQPRKAENTQQPSARPKQPLNKRQPRGGPAGSNGRDARHLGSRPQAGVGAKAAEQRAGTNRAGGRVAVGSSRQQASGAHSQRPAVQGAAVTVTAISGGGDGDGAVAGASSMAAALTNPVAAGGMLLSRTSSQGSLHSSTSNVSNSRVSGVGKESNNTRYTQSRTSARAYATIPGSQDPAAAVSRVGPPSQHSQRVPPPQRPPPPQHQPKAQPSAPSGGPQAAHPHPTGRSPPGKQKSGAAAAAAGPRAVNSRSAQLQQQHQQLQNEQQRLLHKQRQLQQQQQHKQHQYQLGGMESPDGDNLIHHQADTVVTQVGHMQQESQRQEQSGNGPMVTEVQGMEEVRSALQSMLRLPRDPPSFDQRGFDFAESASDLLMDRPAAHYPHEVDASSLPGFRAGGPEDMTEMFESFPSFSFKMFSDMSSMSAASERSLHGENAHLREHLEKERYRRKHCEQQIQSLNAKLLEVQQQLAVAVSTDKRKDIMIDQLDKQLAKVVEGWKKREAEKDEYMSMMMKEKSQIEETLQKQQAMIDSFEKELANTVEELKQEKENSSELLDNMKEQLASATQSQRHAEEMLTAEKERVTLMEKDWDQLKEARDLAEKRAQQAQDRLHQEQDNWYQREQELVHKIDQVKEANLKVMQMERVKLEEQTRKVEEMEEKVHSANTEVKRLEMDLDSAIREKESLKVEMALMEAKFESAQRSLEADLQATMEKEITEQVSQVQDRMRQEQEEQAEKHRQMVTDLHQRHQRDLEIQMASLRQDLGRREDDLKQQLSDMETRVNEARQENSALKQAKQKLESQRLEVLNKLQVIMQSQWNEAVSLLVTTPQRKTLNTSLSSSLGGSTFAGGGGGGILGQLSSSAATAASAPHFNIAGGQSRSAGTSNTALSGQPAGHPECTEPSGRSSPLNNLSGSQSSHSSPPSPAHLRAGNPMSTSGLKGQPPQKDSSGGSLSFPPADSGVSLQDLTTLLSENHYLPPGMASSIHGVTHHGGLVINTHPPHQPSPPHPLHPHHPSQVRQPPQSESQAFMIRPPQQSSRSAGSVHEDFSFISDISHHSLVLPRDGAAAFGEQLVERERVQSGDSHHGSQQPSFVSDRRLELRDLEVEAQAGLRGNVLMAGGAVLEGGRGDGASRIGSSGTAYPPSLSPPVKQGRDGEQDSVDGSVMNETDRLNSSYREISRQLEEHQLRQRELQHYIKMLLDKPPGVGSDQPERDSVLDPDAMDISFGSIATELGLTEAAQAAQLNSELLRLQQLRDRQQVTADQPALSARPKSGSRRPDVPRHPVSQSKPGGSKPMNQQLTGVLAPHQLAEISRLLGQYSEDVEANHQSAASTQADPSSVAQILRFLASLPQNQGTEGEKISSTKSSPRQQQSRRTREQQRVKKQVDPRHHSVGPDTSLSSSSVTTEKQDRSMASSTRSTGATSTRKADRKATNGTPTTPALSTSKQGVHPHGKEQQQPVWK